MTYKPEPLSLYLITYVEKPNTPITGIGPLAEVIHLNTEQEYQSWLTNSYATAKAKYDVHIAKRNDGPPQFYPYIDIHPDV